MRTIFPFLIILLLTITGVCALNDWNEPCTFGVCHYDLPQDASSGTLKIWGSHKAISDITPAAGWHILDCGEDDLEQLVRIVCVSQSAPCSHLFSHSGPEGKIVRLPEWCGKNPFARVAKSWVSHDQSIPRRLASQLRKRDGPVPMVYNLVLDVKFSDVDPQHGPINFAIQAATIPNTNTYIDTHLPLHKRSGRQVQRSHEDIVARALTTVKRDIAQHLADIKAGIHKAEAKIQKDVVPIVNAAAHDVKANINKAVHKTEAGAQKAVHVVDKAAHDVKVDVPKVAENTVHRVEDGAKKDAGKVKDEAQKVVHDVKTDFHKAKVEIPKLAHDVAHAVTHPKATFQEAKQEVHKIDQDAKKPFNLHKTVHFSPQIANRSITLFKETFNCPPMYPGFEVDLNPNGTIKGTIGLVASGTIIPPHLNDFRVVASLSADVTAILQINAELTIMYDSGQIKILQFPLAGIEFPGILSLGPNLALAVQLVLLYDFAAGTRINFGYQVENLVLEFPKKGPTPHPNIGFKKGSFSLSSTPFARNVLQAVIHLIPLVELEFKLFDKFGTTADLQVDNMIVLKLPIEGDQKTHVIKPREFSEAETVAFDARGLLQDMPLVVRGATEFALRSWHDSGSTSMENRGGVGSTFFSLFRRLVSPPLGPPGPGPWPGGNGVLENTNTTTGPAINACLEAYYILDVSLGFTEAIPTVFGINLDQNSRLWLFRKVATLIMDCVGTSQPHGHSSMNNIMADLNDLKNHLFRRSEGLSSVKPHFLGHKCTSKTVGMAMANEIGGAVIGGDNYHVFSLSHTGPI